MKRFAKLLLLILLSTLFYKFITSESKQLFIFPRPALKGVVEKSMEGVKGRYGIYIKNLKTKEDYFSKENEVFSSGSLYKLWVMEEVFKRVNEGTLKENEVLSADIDYLNRRFDVSPEKAELTGGGIKQAVLLAVEQMITISHNYSAMLLLDKLSDDKIRQETTPEEVGLFFENLYKRQIINGDYSNKMLDILSRQKINDRIPKLLPPETRIAHKTADLSFFEHDAGIVFSPKGDYIFVVLSESNMPDAAGKRIAELSKAVFDFFNK